MAHINESTAIQINECDERTILIGNNDQNNESYQNQTVKNQRHKQCPTCKGTGRIYKGNYFKEKESLNF